jgi:hypothetical protein
MLARNLETARAGALMTPEEIAARTRLEQEAGQNAVRDTEAAPQDSRGMEGRDTPRLLEFIEPATAQEWAQLPIDPEVELPTDITGTIARGEAKFQEFQRHYKKQQRTTHTNPKATAPSPIISSVVDQKTQDRRDAAISALEKQSAEKGGQPPMAVRQRVACILLDRLLAEGVRFATARDSQMNKLVREQLNAWAARSRDRSKSRSKPISPDAVRRLLRQIKGLAD